MDPSPLVGLSKWLIGFGFAMMMLGAALYFAGRIPGGGRMPGDILIQKGNFSFYFPLATCLLLSVILTVLLNLFRRS